MARSDLSNCTVGHSASVIAISNYLAAFLVPCALFLKPSRHGIPQSHYIVVIMISDRDLYSLAIFFGVVSVLLILAYQFMEANAISHVAGADKVDHAKAS
ncbi:hypothetical protein E4U42_002411 [Claviceps africana]|uniref:Uncharacterized protein n=1 Tax=Claviceps africana TaxID=83212 RepID=A0A8K0JAP8_9HYPO|nr:hypothetical protein E4U42_002411 [Claviceps africana]